MADSALGTRTLSFLMTDIEGSTDRWNRQAEEMSAAMQIHNAIIDRCVHGTGGRMLDSAGDSWAASFDEALAALEAAGQIQLELIRADLPVGLRVRIGLHHGEVYPLSPVLFGGATLCFLGRLHKAAHGGQILLSEEMRLALGAPLPSHWEIEDLGDHLFRDFHRRRVHQANRLGAATLFPPLVAPRPSSLPPLPTATRFGVAPELAAADHRRLSHRIVSLVGPGGIGKTRLALEMSHRLQAHYRDGATWAELKGLAPDDVAAAVATSLFVDPMLESTPEASIRRAIRGRDLLIVLDNCDEVIDRVGRLVGELTTDDRIDVLVTSRLPLGIVGEEIRPLMPLLQPDPAASLSEVADNEAVQLLVDRVTERRPSFAVDQSNRLAIAQICRRLSGVPLDLELAAAALQFTAPADLAVALGEVGSGGRALGASGRAGIGWSLDHLDQDQRQVVDALAVFPGGADQNLLVQLAPALGRSRLHLALSSLAQRAVVLFEETASGGWYRMLEPLRDEVLVRLEPVRRAETERMHAELVSSLVLSAAASLQGPDEGVVVDDLHRLQASIRATVKRDSIHDADRAVALCAALHEHCMLRMQYEVYDWVNQLIDGPVPVSTGAESMLLAIRGLGAFNRGQLDPARLDCVRSIEMCTADDLEVPVQAHFGLMAVYGFQQEFGLAQHHFSEAMRWCSVPGRTYFLVNALVLVSMALTIQGDGPGAIAVARDALDRAATTGNPSCQAWALVALADAERLSSPGASHVHLDEALTLARRVHSRWIEGQALLNLAQLRLQDSWADSAAVLIEALASVAQTGSPVHGRQALRLAMVLLAEAGRHREAAVLLGGALREDGLLPPSPDTADALGRAEASIDNALGAAVAAALCDRGRRSPTAELVAEARAALSDLLE